MMGRYLLTFVCSTFLCFISAANPLDSVRVTKHKTSLYIIHKVDKGDGLIALARRYNTSVDEIKKANSKLQQLKVGQKINIPYTEPITRNDKSISDSSKISIDDSHANADSKELTLVKLHTVQAGETLSKISVKYKVSVSQIIKWNAIKNNKIDVGQQLIVSGNVTIKPYEKWNAPNSLSAKPDSVKDILASTLNLIEESGRAAITAVNTHPSLPVGSFVLCINPDSQKQILIQIERTAPLPPAITIGLNEDNFSLLNLAEATNRINIKYNQK